MYAKKIRIYLRIYAVNILFSALIGDLSKRIDLQSVKKSVYLDKYFFNPYIKNYVFFKAC